MAQAAEAADEIVVMSDNPRFEPPGQIIADILVGFNSPDRVLTCVDRQHGIRARFESLNLAMSSSLLDADTNKLNISEIDASVLMIAV